MCIQGSEPLFCQVEASFFYPLCLSEGRVIGFDFPTDFIGKGHYNKYSAIDQNYIMQRLKSNLFNNN